MRLPLASAAVTVWVLGGPASAKFGLTTSGNSYSVDTNGGLVFDVNKQVFLSESQNAFEGGDLPWNSSDKER